MQELHEHFSKTTHSIHAWNYKSITTTFCTFNFPVYISNIAHHQRLPKQRTKNFVITIITKKVEENLSTSYFQVMQLFITDTIQLVFTSPFVPASTKGHYTSMKMKTFNTFHSENKILKYLVSGIVFAGVSLRLNKVPIQ